MITVFFKYCFIYFVYNKQLLPNRGWQMVPPKFWHLQTFHPISKSQLTAFAKSLKILFILHLFQCEAFMFCSDLVSDSQTRVSDFNICHPSNKFKVHVPTLSYSLSFSHLNLLSQYEEQ